MPKYTLFPFEIKPQPHKELAKAVINILYFLLKSNHNHLSVTGCACPKYTLFPFEIKPQHNIYSLSG